jgi:hypothetical protein
MHALHLPSRHLWFTALLALVLALAVLAAGDWLSQLELFSGGAAAETTAAPPPTWADDPLAPPTTLLTR